MTSIRRAAPAALWAVQWSLAFTLFVLGLLKIGLRAEDLALEGLIQALAAMALVIPSATGFWPRLSPFVAALLASIMATGAAAPFAPAGLAWRLAGLLLAAGCAAVAVGRGFLLPVSPVDLRPEAVDPFARPPEVVALARLATQGSLELQRAKPKPRKRPPGPSPSQPDTPKG